MYLYVGGKDRTHGGCLFHASWIFFGLCLVSGLKFLLCNIVTLFTSLFGGKLKVLFYCDHMSTCINYTWDCDY